MILQGADKLTDSLVHVFDSCQDHDAVGDTTLHQEMEGIPAAKSKKATVYHKPKDVNI